MKIIWNKVTWYSKLLAMVFFVALPFIGFWWGMQYGELLAPLNASSSLMGPGTHVGSNSYYSNVSQWQTDQRPDAGFSMAFPSDFMGNDNYTLTTVTDWRIGSNNQPGVKMLTVTIPGTFEPETNFADATLTVGKSTNQLAVSQCLTPDQTGGPVGANMKGATTTINGVPFMIFKSASAGAGNFYETTSYRTIHTGACYAVEYTVHSNQIANYPSSYHLRPFSQNKVTAVLDLMVGTFKFL